VSSVLNHLFGIQLKEPASWDAKKPTSGTQILKNVNAQNQLPTKSTENVSHVMLHLNGKPQLTLANLKLTIAPHQLPQQFQRQSRQCQLFKHALQTLFGTVTFRNVYAHQTFHSMMERNVCNAIYLSIGIMTWNNVWIVHKTNILTLCQDHVRHARHRNHCGETPDVRDVQAEQVTTKFQTVVRALMTSSTHQWRAKSQFMKQFQWMKVSLTHQQQQKFLFTQRLYIDLNKIYLMDFLIK
jgi:hypothetical protein